MRFITAAAISRRTVTLLAVFILLAGGVYAYNSLRVELFPEIEFPLVTVTASYPAVDPEGVLQEVTAPIERAISGVEGLESVQSTSFEGNSIVLANFEFGTDMANAESTIESAVNGISFPDGVEEVSVGRINPDQFPVLQFSVVSGQEPSDVTRVVESQILPELFAVDGVMRMEVTGQAERLVQVAVDPDLLKENKTSLFQVASALSDNNVTLPSGLISGEGQSVVVKTTHTLDSVEDIRGLVVGASPSGPVLLSDVASVVLADAGRTSISRTNGQRSVGVAIVKDPEANTIEVTEAVRDVLDNLTNLPPGMEIVIVSDDGPEIQEQIDTLLREAGFGFLFAVTVIFAFMLSTRPTVFRGVLRSLRPTVVIALAIPLSVLTGVLLLAWQDMSLNFMTLGGLAISVGRVVDDAIVVLENVYRHIHAGRERWRAALEATTEVGPAIFASTLTTIVVFLPLAFIEGLVGEFFLPFALTISFALAASLVVALTAVPVLGAYLLRRGDLPDEAGEDEVAFVQETWMQRAYTPALRWALGHKAVILVGATAITGASLLLLAVIPITLFPSGGDRQVRIELSLPAGTSRQQTLEEVVEIERRVRGYSELYTSTVGATGAGLRGGPTGLNEASLLLVLRPDAPDDVANIIREELEEPGRVIRVSEISAGPPTSGVEISITGPNYNDIAASSRELMSSLSSVDGVANLESDVALARDEVAIRVDPAAAAAIGLNTRQVGLQLNQFLVGRTVTTINIDGRATDVVVSGNRQAVSSIEGVRDLVIAGPLGDAPLGELAEVQMDVGPVTITRTDGRRSASITGDIIEANTQAVGAEIDAKIATLSLPPGVSVISGGIFADIAEGFQAIFLSMAIGIVLMYLVMVASLGSLRNPIVIVTSLPLALVGVLAALAITGRALGLPAMMGALLLIGIVVTNGIVLIAFVEQLRAKGFGVMEGLITAGRVRLRPILMTALTTSFALMPLAAFSGGAGGIISAELATVVIGGLITSTALTLIVAPVVYYLFNVSIPGLFRRGH